MQYHGKTQKIIPLILLNIIVLISISASPNFAYAQDNPALHQKTLYYLYEKHASSQSPHIPVGRGPIGIGVNEHTNRIYVANGDDGTVSVIDGNDSKVVKTIQVGRGPWGISVNEHTNRIYVANFDSDTVSVIDGNDSKVIKTIQVGRGPANIGVNEDTNTIYVALEENFTVSVINGNTNAIIENLGIGIHPTAISVNNHTNTVYVANGDGTVSVIDGDSGNVTHYIKVASHHNDILLFYNKGIGVLPTKGGEYIKGMIYVTNYHNNTVSVINGSTNAIIENITVGRGPYGVAVNGLTNTTYITNHKDNSVSVIDGNDNKVKNVILVGSGPLGVAVNGLTNTTYITNHNDNSVSVIDTKANKVVAKVMFNIKPVNAGNIECDNTTISENKLVAPTAQQFYIYSGSECIAKPNQGFQFVSWQENLGGNSTHWISGVRPPSFLDSIRDSILDFLRINPDKPEAKLPITKFGDFTANFKALPPPIPPEYIATLFGIVVTAFVSSWLTPAIIGWRKTKRQRKYFKECENQIGKLDKDTIEEKIIGYYVDGKISQEHRQFLNDKISDYYEKEKGSERYGAPIG